jgi:hypothetical protein
MRYSKSADARIGAWLRYALLLAAIALAGGCGLLEEQQPGSLGIRHAQLARGATPRLELALDCRLSGPMQDALDHGIPIVLEADVRAGRWPRAVHAKPRIELRWFPLSRRYQLRTIGSDEVRAFATQAHLLSALGSLRLALPSAFDALPQDAPLQVSVAIDPAALPGALRLPALFEPAWRLASAETTWPAAQH